VGRGSLSRRVNHIRSKDQYPELTPAWPVMGWVETQEICELDFLSLHQKRVTIIPKSLKHTFSSERSCVTQMRRETKKSKISTVHKGNLARIKHFNLKNYKKFQN
jgi:hypothetical protein